MKRISNLFNLLKDRQLLVGLIVTIGSVRTAYYGMVTKIDVLTVQVASYSETQKKEETKLSDAIIVRNNQHEIINSKLGYLMPTVKSLAISHNLPIYEQ